MQSINNFVFLPFTLFEIIHTTDLDKIKEQTNSSPQRTVCSAKRTAPNIRYHNIVSKPMNSPMRKIKGSSSYLKNQVRKNLVKAALSILIFGAILIALALRVLFTLQVGTLEEAGLLFSIAPLVGFYFYLRKYRIYSGGWEGEKQVAKLLTNKLNDDYY